MVFNNVILKVKYPQRIDEIAGLLSQLMSAPWGSASACRIAVGLRY